MRKSIEDQITDDEIADQQDMHRTRNRRRPSKFWKTLTHLGPGIITGCADDDPSGIGTYSIAGAQFGYGLLWLCLLCVPMMIAVQEMCGRMAAITGKGLAAVLRDHYPKWLLWGAICLLCVANIINVWADLNIMAASAAMLFGLSLVTWLIVITTVIIGLIILVPYRDYVKVLKWLTLAFGAYVVVALMPEVHNNWAQIGRSAFIPHWEKGSAYILTIVAFLGTTITPYLFFWQASETVEDSVGAGHAAPHGGRRTAVKKAEIVQIRSDTVIGMVVSQVITFFIVICAAGTLHAHGMTDINTAQDAAKALLPLGGKPAYWLFTLGILGAGLLGIPTMAGSVAYAVAESVGWPYGLYRRFHRAREFYGAIAAVIGIGFALNFAHAFSPVKGLLYAAVINGVVAPPLIVILLLICNNHKIVKGRVNSALGNFVGAATALLMAVAVGVMVWALCSGKA